MGNVNELVRLSAPSEATKGSKENGALRWRGLQPADFSPCKD